MSRVSRRVIVLSIIAGLVYTSPVFSQSMRLQDTALGSVVQIGSYNFVKIGENKYMQSTEVTCPDGSTVGGKYVKCFASKTKYEEQCSGASGSCQYEAADTITTKSGTYTVYDYTCDIPCFSPNAHYNDNREKCVCDEDDYSYINVNGKYGCIPSNDLDIYTAGIDFDYTGNIQTFTVPVDGTYKLEVWGAQGGTSISSGGAGGYGGYTFGNASLKPGDILSIVVGGTGSNKGAGGYNGGGDSSWYRLGKTTYGESSSGGGATHIAIYTSSYTVLSSYNDIATANQYLYIVAGGGGGGTNNAYHGCKSYGGQGGGISGGKSTANINGSYTHGTGGTQTAAGDCCNTSCRGGVTKGSFGQGGLGDTYSSSNAGGGGGYYGGGGGYYYCGGGGGGSAFVNNSKLISGNYGMYCYSGSNGTDSTTACGTGSNSTSGSNVSATATANYAKSGNGFARITLISVD